MRSLVFLLCVQSVWAQSITYPSFDVQGHRGARGLMPENSIVGFLKALELGATTLEMDVVISQDKQVVVSHEAWMRADICSTKGKNIPHQEEKKLNLYAMPYAQIKQYDCGSKGNPEFSTQQKIATTKPLLTDVIKAVEDFIRDKTKYAVDYSIEIKCEPETDNIFHPAPAVFSDLVYETIDAYLDWKRVVIQSFDKRVLQYWHTKYPSVRLAYLTDNTHTCQQNIFDLGFTPSVYSPSYHQVTQGDVTYAHANKMRIVPYTVNEISEIYLLKNWKADGVITDFPDKAIILALPSR